MEDGEVRGGLPEGLDANHLRPAEGCESTSGSEITGGRIWPWATVRSGGGLHGEPVEEELKERRCPDQPVLVAHTEECRSHHSIVARTKLHRLNPCDSNRWGPPQ